MDRKFRPLLRPGVNALLEQIQNRLFVHILEQIGVVAAYEPRIGMLYVRGNMLTTPTSQEVEVS